MPTTSAFRIPVANLLRRPGRVPDGRRPRARSPTCAGPGAEVARRPADRRRPHPRAGLRGHRRAGHGHRAAGTRRAAAASARSAASSPCTSTSCSSATRSRARPTCSPRTTSSTSSRWSATRSCSSCPRCRCAAPTAAGLCPTCGVDHNLTTLRLRHRASPTPAGRRCGRSSSDPLDHDHVTRSCETMAVPKRKMSRSATRSRKSANMRLVPPRALAVPELRRVAASPPGVRQLWLVPRPPGPRRRVADGRPVPPVIAIDAMGGDRAPAEIVAGALRGRRRVRRRRAARRPARRDRARTCPAARRPARVEVLDASEVIAMDEEPAAAVRAKKDSSIVRGAEAVRDGRAAAMVGAGNTGATMAAALLRFGRIKGVHRPAIAVPLPVFGEDRLAAARRRRRDRRSRARSGWSSGPSSPAPTRASASASTSRRSRCSRTVKSRARATRCARPRRPLLADVKGFVGNVEGRDLLRAARRRDRHRRLHRQRRAEDRSKARSWGSPGWCSACSTSPVRRGPVPPTR